MQHPSENTLILRTSINDAVTTAWLVVRETQLKLGQIEALKKVAESSYENAVMTHSRLLDVSGEVELVFSELGIASRGESRTMKYARRRAVWASGGGTYKAAVIVIVACVIAATIAITL